MNKIYKESLVRAVGTVAYITIVATIMENAEELFGKTTGFLAPIAFLLLFTLSAMVVGSLILGKPIMLYLDAKKKEAVQMLFASIGWLAIFTVVTLLILILK